MKKQFLSILAAGFTLGGVSQTKAMDPRTYYDAAIDSHEIERNQTDNRQGIIANARDINGTPEVRILLEIKGEENDHVRLINSRQLLSSAPLVKPRENETIADYLIRFERQRTLLLRKYASRILRDEQYATKEESINDL